MSAARKPRVLVCDDEQQILRALRVILRDAGFEALPANDAEEALEMGLVNTVVPVDQLEAEGVQWASEILSKSPIAIRFLKAGLNADLRRRVQEHGWRARATIPSPRPCPPHFRRVRPAIYSYLGAEMGCIGAFGR